MAKVRNRFMGPIRGAYRCTCGKWSYPTRKQARMASRQAHPGEVLNAYRCALAQEQRGLEVWHYGHLQEGDRQ